MAQRVQIQLTDDLTGEDAQETVRFGLEGTDYEIDLTSENAENLRSALSEYMEKGRKANTGRKSQAAQKSGPVSGSGRSKEETQRIRQWAQDNGHNPSSRGRLNQSIVDAYNEANT